MSKSVLPFYNNTIRKESVRLGLLRQGFKRGFLDFTSYNEEEGKEEEEEDEYDGGG